MGLGPLPQQGAEVTRGVPADRAGVYPGPEVNTSLDGVPRGD